jgi:hypothetical protein
MVENPDSVSDPFSSPTDSGRYVILLHRWPQGPLRCFDETEPEDRVIRRGGDHFDWMFQSDSCLATWATAKRLSVDQKAETGAIRLPDHRITYLDYEGSVSGDRGTVARVESGGFRLISASPDRFEIQTFGDRSGVLAICRVKAFRTFIVGDDGYRTWCGDGFSFWRISFRPSADGRPTRADAN